MAVTDITVTREQRLVLQTYADLGSVGLVATALQKSADDVEDQLDDLMTQFGSTSHVNLIAVAMRSGTIH